MQMVNMQSRNPIFEKCLHYHRYVCLFLQMFFSCRCMYCISVICSFFYSLTLFISLDHSINKYWTIAAFPEQSYLFTDTSPQRSQTDFSKTQLRSHQPFLKRFRGCSAVPSTTNLSPIP